MNSEAIGAIAPKEEEEEEDDQELFSSQISVTLVSVLFTPPLVNPIYQQLSR